MTLEIMLEKHRRDIDKLNNERHLWLWASSIVFSGIILLIFGWNWLSGINSKTIWWVIVSLMLIISINWWYWTMRVIRIIIYYQEIEYSLIKEIHNEINWVKEDMKKSFDPFIKRS